MQTITGLDIVAAYKEFSLARTYQERLTLFDHYFNLLPFSFANFDEQISFLRLESAIDRMYRIHKEESQPSVVLRKVFTIAEADYVFDVTPVNSLPPVFNAYILDKFINSGMQSGAFTNGIQEDTCMGMEAKRLIDESDTIMEELQQCLQVKKRQHFRAQLVSVFFSGYHDAASGIVKTSGTEKKFLNCICMPREFCIAGIVKNCSIRV